MKYVRLECLEQEEETGRQLTPRGTFLLAPRAEIAQVLQILDSCRFLFQEIDATFMRSEVDCSELDRSLFRAEQRFASLEQKLPALKAILLRAREFADNGLVKS